MKKTLSLVLVLALCLSCAACGAKKEPPATIPAETTTAPTTEETFPPEDVIILYTNDIHTAIEEPLNFAVLAALKEDLEAELGTGNVLLVDTGDIIQGSAYGYMDNGLTMIRLMNAARYDAATLGNHEFDYGMTATMAVIDTAAFPFLCCNFYHEETGNVLPSSRVFETPGGLSIGFVGVTTPETMEKLPDEYFQDGSGNFIYGIAGGEDGSALVERVQSAVDQVEGADAVIVLGHLGNEEGASPWTSREVIAAVSGIDAFIDGNCHSIVPGEEVPDKNGEPVLLTQTGRHFGAIGMMHIDRFTGAITTDLIECVEVLEPILDASGNPVKDSSGKEKTRVGGYAFESELLQEITDTQWCVSEEVKAIQDSWIQEIWIAENMKW